MYWEIATESTFEISPGKGGVIDVKEDVSRRQGQGKSSNDQLQWNTGDRQGRWGAWYWTDNNSNKPEHSRSVKEISGSLGKLGLVLLKVLIN
jgi:hypothetical protein